MLTIKSQLACLIEVGNVHSSIPIIERCFNWNCYRSGAQQEYRDQMRSDMKFALFAPRFFTFWYHKHGFNVYKRTR